MDDKNAALKFPSSRTFVSAAPVTEIRKKKKIESTQKKEKEKMHTVITRPSFSISHTTFLQKLFHGERVSGENVVCEID